jgi:Restriction endonuclease
MVEWKRYRGKHLVDVSVVFSKFGLHQHWIIECKFWKHAVPKEKVLVLKSIIEDVGANRGILVSESGHQSGALAAARHTNIMLSSLDELREAAREELLSLGLSEIHRRAARMKGDVFSLWKTERHRPGYSTSTIRPGVDGALASSVGGAIFIIAMGAEQAMLGTLPVPLRFWVLAIRWFEQRTLTSSSCPPQKFLTTSTFNSPD